MELIINNLSVTYPNGIEALKNVSMKISNGMFGLLGPNGAGKSTLMRIIATLQQPTDGNVIFNGQNILTHSNEMRKQLGYLPQEFGVYPKITAEKLLLHLAVLKGITVAGERKDIVESLLVKTNLYEHKNKNLGGFSGGMKQRFGIAQALLNNPKLMIVDEPTAGLDPAERNRFLNLLSELGENTIVILSTHIVDDVKELCTDMAILDHGMLLFKGSPKDAINEMAGKIWKKQIDKDQLKEYKMEYNVLYEKLYLGKSMIYILSEKNPGMEFQLTDPNLEAYYFSKIKSSKVISEESVLINL